MVKSLAVRAVAVFAGISILAGPGLAADPAPPPPSAAHAAEASPGAQWATFNNHLDGRRYSTLKQINTANVGRLGEVCRVQVDGPTTFNAGLVLANGLLYGATGRETVAVDARTCAIRWRYSYVPVDDTFSASSRGVAVMNGRVFRGTGDARLIALDALTGKLLWSDIIGAPERGESAGAAPLAADGVVYMGIGGSEFGVRGRVMAFDAVSGRELWRFNTIPMGEEKGADTWQRPQTAKTGGGGVWGAMSLDVTTGELFVPVGNPWPDIDTAYRPGDNLFTDSMVVLDARTGALKWWHQVARKDWKDVDMVAAPVLYRDDKIRDIMAMGGKDGFVTAVDRDTRQVLFRTPVTTIGPPLPGATPAGVDGCPSYAGGVEWNGPALDPVNNSLVVGSVDVCFKVKSGPTVYSQGEAVYGGTIEPSATESGWVTSLDSRTGAVRWKYHAEKPVIAGVTPTAGGLTFTGDLAGNLLIFNSRTGELVRKLQTGGALAGGMITYEIAGRQYLAFTAGNVSRTAWGALGLPSVVVMALDTGHSLQGAAQATAGVAVTQVGAGEIDAGRKLYSQVCASCHGADGNTVADHKLSTLPARLDHAGVVAFIKNPKLPMPKLYPNLINAQSVADVTAYLYDDIVRK
jgi:alcohol dehydrogenase (cytochrome c)